MPPMPSLGASKKAPLLRMTMLLRDDEVFHQQCPRDYLLDVADRHSIRLTIVGTPEALGPALADAEVYVGSEAPPDGVPPTLEWIHAISAGVEKLMVPAIRASSLRVTNSAGTMAAEVAEHVLALILAHTRRLDRSIAAQRRHLWAPLRRDHPPLTLKGLVVGIVGYGHIGRAVASHVMMLGATVIGMRRSPAEPDGVAEQILGRADLPRLLERADIVVAIMPGAADTRSMFDLDAFRTMKPTAYFVNVGRGIAVDEAALLRALSEGMISGAACDVFVDEPLPPESPLWEAPNLIVTPHLGGASQHVWTSIIDLLFDNVDRWRHGEPLLNEVDKELQI